MGSRKDRIIAMRRFIPLPILLRLGRRKAAKLWRNPEFRAAQEANMKFVLEFTDRAEEIPELARRYAEFDILRNYRRWHPAPLFNQRVEGIEWLTTKKDPDRGIVLSFTHHGQYDGLVASVARAGAYMHSVVAPDAFDPNAPLPIRQHYKLCSSVPESPLISTEKGSGYFKQLLEEGKIFTIASDVAGRTEVTFLGRTMLGSFGAARLATDTNSPVVLLTSHQDRDGSPFMRIHPPIEPADFDNDPAKLLAEILRQHEPAVLAWPEAYDSPRGRLEIPAQQAASR
jgi:lauroyl/myristoyl acyltransferase